MMLGRASHVSRPRCIHTLKAAWISHGGRIPSVVAGIFNRRYFLYAERVESTDISRPVRCVIRVSIITAPYSRPISSARCGRSIAPFICLALKSVFACNLIAAREQGGRVRRQLGDKFNDAEIDKNLLSLSRDRNYGYNKLNERISCLVRRMPFQKDF